MELIGWLGSLALALCGLPQAIKSYREGHSNGISWGLLSLWTIGEILTLVYIIPTFQWPLLFNYTCNLLFLAVMIYFKLKPRSKA